MCNFVGKKRLEQSQKSTGVIAKSFTTNTRSFWQATIVRSKTSQNISGLVYSCYASLARAGNPYWRGRQSTIDLHVLTIFDQLLLILKILLNFVARKATLMRSSTVLSLPLQLVFPGWTISAKVASDLQCCLGQALPNGWNWELLIILGWYLIRVTKLIWGQFYKNVCL
jgi:hypothetical protein